MHAPSGAEARVAAHPSVNANGAARHLHDEWLEEYEAGVFMKLKDLGDGTRELKRVRFSKRRFGEHQAENWWKENREKVYERYNIRTSQQASSAAPTHSIGLITPPYVTFIVSWYCDIETGQTLIVFSFCRRFLHILMLKKQHSSVTIQVVLDIDMAFKVTH
ncbi:hypothetical protein TRIUR3_04358 [Triticum urartu]|uniref:Uncharacterized protein n=1 Tax=Triticum urartu TaxID=4572 RepID=M8A937_TRIUA|nr:hypothetical protein TRIUR3_04358 [Triticum urartu]